MNSETYNEQFINRLTHKQEITLLLIFALAAFCGFCLILFGLFDKPAKTTGFFLNNPAPKELHFHTHNSDKVDLIITNKEMLGELKDLIYDKELKLNCSDKQDVDHIHMAWGYGGSDFDILEDGRIRIFVFEQFIADKSLTYGIALKIRMALSGSKRLCYESKPDRKTYLKAMELLKAAE